MDASSILTKGYADDHYLTEDTKFLIKDYPTFDDFPQIAISYVIRNRTFDFDWGPPESYYTYQGDRWVSEISNQNISLSTIPSIYTLDDCRNVTCKITYSATMSEYPDAAVDSYGLSLSESESGPNMAVYKETFKTEYSSSAYNPCTKKLSGTFDIYFPDKVNPEIIPNCLYRALDTGKMYYADLTRNSWVEYTGLSLNITNIGLVLEAKQDALVSGKNIKTISRQSILGEGNIDVATIATLNNYLLKTYVVTSRSTSAGRTYAVSYINNMLKTARTTSSYVTYDCTYINSLIKTTSYVSNNHTYSCSYIDSQLQRNLQLLQGYDPDPNKTQVLKNINGTLQWVDE